MWRTMCIKQRAEGQSIVLVALVLLLLLAFSGLALDGANAFNQRRNANNGADAAALAGTRVIITQKRIAADSGSADASNSSAVYQAIEQYLNQHALDQGVALTWEAFYVDRQAVRLSSGAQITNDTTNVPNHARGVEVTLRYTFDTFLMQVLGQADLTVDADATAVYGPSTTVIGGGLIPLALSQYFADSTSDGDLLCIFGSPDADAGLPCPGSGAYGIRPGNFGQLSFNPNNAPNATGNYNQDCLNPANPQDNMSYWWCNGSQYPIDIGDQLWGDTGMLSNSLADEMQWRITNAPEGIVPVFGYVDDGTGNNARYTIVGFMAVRLQAFNVQGSAAQRWVSATRVSYTTTPGSFSSGAVDGGVYSVNLVR